MLEAIIIVSALVGIWAWIELGKEEAKQKARKAAQEPKLTPIQQKVRDFHMLTEKAEKCREIGENHMADYYDREAGEIVRQLRHINPGLPGMVLLK